jgi:hypothetical protein
MQAQGKPRWRSLCERAISEQDANKFLAIVSELSTVLAEEDRRVKAPRKPSASSRASQVSASKQPTAASQ